MKIVVLDGYCLNPGDLDWSPLSAIGEVTIYDRTPHEQLLERAQGAEVLLTNKTIIDAAAIDALPKLKYIGVLATGYNVVDIPHARQKKITVTNIPAYSTNSVAQMTFAHIMNITLRVGHYAHQNTNGAWSRSADFSYADTPLIELAGKTIGIVGMGYIGTAVSRIATAMGMKVMAFTHRRDLPDTITIVDKETIFRESDILTLHCPLTDDTRNFADAHHISLMKPTAIIINTGRGPLIDETALATALNESRIYAAGLDVMCQEPPRPDNPLLTARNCFITPHIAWATKEARTRLINIAIDNVKAWTEGFAQNQVK